MKKEQFRAGVLISCLGTTPPVSAQTRRQPSALLPPHQKEYPQDAPVDYEVSCDWLLVPQVPLRLPLQPVREGDETAGMASTFLEANRPQRLPSPQNGSVSLSYSLYWRLDIPLIS